VTGNLAGPAVFRSPAASASPSGAPGGTCQDDGEQAGMARTDRRNSSRYWHDRHLPGLRLICADFRTLRFAHRHDGLVVAATEAGGSVITCRGVARAADARTLLVFNPMDAHACRMAAGSRWRFRSLCLEPPALAAVARGLDTTGPPYVGRNFIADADLIEGFLALHRALQDGHDVRRERGLLLGSFGALFREHGTADGPPPAPRDRRLTAAVDLMRARLRAGVSLRGLARALDLTEYQVTGLFKRTTGLTPYAYLTQLRLEHARRLLAGGMPIARVAAACGFYDQSALTNHFTGAYGITPRQFVRASADRDR